MLTTTDVAVLCVYLLAVVLLLTFITLKAD